jgi:hypothetical protein
MNHSIPNSLWGTVDQINHSYYFRETIPTKRKRELASWIADRIQEEGGYNGLFAPTNHDYENTVRTFTGEPVTSRAGKAHLLGEEALHSLVLLNVHNTHVDKAKEVAINIIHDIVLQNEVEGKWCGFFCCGKCTVSYWRNLIHESIPFSRPRLMKGLEDLKSLRDGNGRWKRFPFYYTLLAIGDMSSEMVKDELLYIRPVLERLSRRSHTKDSYRIRKEYLIRTLLCKAKKIPISKENQ